MVEEILRGNKARRAAGLSTGATVLFKVRVSLWLEGIMGWGDGSEGEVVTEQA